MRITERSKILLSIAKHKGVGPAKVHEIIRIIKIDDNTYPTGAFLQGLNVKAKLNEELTDDLFNRYYESVETSLKALDDSTDFLLTPLDEEFPKISPLLAIKDSERPFVLSGKGDISLLDSKRSVAIIGTREAGDTARQAIDWFASYFAMNGINIVSGLAIGCDAIAHKSAIDHNGKTIAILATPLNNIQPKQNRPLAEEILSTGGLLLSEYYEPAKEFSLDKGREYAGRLVARDRLQALYSSCVILASSDQNGGSRHAMNKAKEYGISRGVLFSRTFLNSGEKSELNRLISQDGNVNSPVFAIDKPQILDEIVKHMEISLINDLDSGANVKTDVWPETLFDLIPSDEK